MTVTKHGGMISPSDGFADIQLTNDVDHGIRRFHKRSCVCGQIMVKGKRTGLCQEKLSIALLAQDMVVRVIEDRGMDDLSPLLGQTT